MFGRKSNSIKLYNMCGPIVYGISTIITVTVNCIRVVRYAVYWMFTRRTLQKYKYTFRDVSNVRIPLFVCEMSSRQKRQNTFQDAPSTEIKHGNMGCFIWTVLFNINNKYNLRFHNPRAVVLYYKSMHYANIFRWYSNETYFVELI